MNESRVLKRSFWGIQAAALLLVSGGLQAQTQVKPGFNLFSAQQDIEIGQKSAKEVEHQLPILHDRSVERYVEKVGKRLAGAIQGPDFPYQFKVVNVSDVNAFALPGGFMYINRGLIEEADNEAQLAAVMAHEMAHVALRHGTNQASKAYLAQAGLGILGSLFGGQGASSQVIGSLGGFGLNALFLKFSRTDEEQADVVGAQTMARAGYNPMEMAAFFEKLRENAGHNPGKFEIFFSDHPSPEHRAQRIEKEVRILRPLHLEGTVGGFDSIRRRLKRMPPARSMAQIMKQQSQNQPAQPPGGQGPEIGINQPSSRFRQFEQADSLFRIRYPENWRAHSSERSFGVILAPDRGVIRDDRGEENIVYGVIVNRYSDEQANDFREGGASMDRRELARQTQNLVRGILRDNSYLTLQRRSWRNETIDGERGLSVVLSGQSPTTRLEERVTLFSRPLPDGQLFYALFIAPARDYGALKETFRRILSSLKINEQAFKRQKL